MSRLRRRNTTFGPSNGSITIRLAATTHAASIIRLLRESLARTDTRSSAKPLAVWAGDTALELGVVGTVDDGRVLA